MCVCESVTFSYHIKSLFTIWLYPYFPKTLFHFGVLLWMRACDFCEQRKSVDFTHSNNLHALTQLQLHWLEYKKNVCVCVSKMEKTVISNREKRNVKAQKLLCWLQMQLKESYVWEMRKPNNWRAYVDRRACVTRRCKAQTKFLVVKYVIIIHETLFCHIKHTWIWWQTNITKTKIKTLIKTEEQKRTHQCWIDSSHLLCGAKTRVFTYDIGNSIW